MKGLKILPASFHLPNLKDGEVVKGKVVSRSGNKAEVVLSNGVRLFVDLEVDVKDEFSAVVYKRGSLILLKVFDPSKGPIFKREKVLESESIKEVFRILKAVSLPITDEVVEEVKNALERFGRDKASFLARLIRKAVPEKLRKSVVNLLGSVQANSVLELGEEVMWIVVGVFNYGEGKDERKDRGERETLHIKKIKDKNFEVVIRWEGGKWKSAGVFFRDDYFGLVKVEVKRERELYDVVVMLEKFNPELTARSYELEENLSLKLGKAVKVEFKKLVEPVSYVFSVGGGNVYDGNVEIDALV